MIKKKFLLISFICNVAGITASEPSEFTPNETSIVTPHEKKQLKDRLLPFSNIAIKDISTEKLLHYLIFLPQQIVDYSAWHFFDRKTVSPEQQESLGYKEYFEKIGAGKIRKAMQPVASIGATLTAWYFLYRPALRQAFLQARRGPSFAAKQKKQLEEQLTQTQQAHTTAKNTYTQQDSLLNSNQNEELRLTTNLNDVSREVENLERTVQHNTISNDYFVKEDPPLEKKKNELIEENRAWEHKAKNSMSDRAAEHNNAIDVLTEENNILKNNMKPVIANIANSTPQDKIEQLTTCKEIVVKLLRKKSKFLDLHVCFL